MNEDCHAVTQKILRMLANDSVAFHAVLGEAINLLFQVLLNFRQVFVSSGVQLLANHSLEDSTESFECHGRFEAVFVRWLSATHIEVVDGGLEL